MYRSCLHLTVEPSFAAFSEDITLLGRGLTAPPCIHQCWYFDWFLPHSLCLILKSSSVTLKVAVSNPRVISNQQDSTDSTQQQNNSQYSLQIKSNRLNHLFWRPELIKLMTRFVVLMLTRAHANTAKTKANAVIRRQMVILKIRKSGETDYWWAGERLSLWIRWTTWILKKHALHIFF